MSDLCIECGAENCSRLWAQQKKCCPDCSHKSTLGNGDFSIGNRVWPGTSKLIEETGELQQVLGKLIAVAGAAETHWSGNLREKLVEEIGDVRAALAFFVEENITEREIEFIEQRSFDKLELFRKWHTEQQ